MIRRSRISVRPNVRPGGRSAPSSQDVPKKNEDPPSQASVGSELTKPASAHPLPTPAEACKSSTQEPEPEMAASSQEEVSQSSKQALGPQQLVTAHNVGLSKQQHSPALTDMDNETASSLPASTHRRTLSPHNHTTSAKSISPRVTINNENDPSTGSMQVKADDKAPQKPKGRQRPVAVPRQPRAKRREDIQSHSQQQTGIKSPSKRNTETLVSSSEERTLTSLETTSPQPDPSSNMEICKVSEGSQPRPSPEQVVTPTSEKGKCKRTNRAPGALKPQGLYDPADLIRLGKAQKLRELLKLEICKERSQKTITVKTRRIQYDTLKDPSKMTMRELIYYLPKTNPMKSYHEVEEHPSETILASPVPSHGSEERPAQLKQQIQSQLGAGEEEQEHEDDAAGLSDSEPSEPILVPQVKVAEDGTLIIDEESLTVEVLRAKGPNPTEDRDPIFERGSTTTYSSFRKGCYTKPWSSQETDMFFLAISMVGTDFSMIGSMFPHRARSEIKNKFKKEERANAWRIDKAFREKRRLDLEFFTELLDKILADEQRRKNNKLKPTLGPKTPQKRDRKKPRARKPVIVASDTEDSADEDLISELTEGEKENEDSVNELETVKSKKSRNRGEVDSSPKKPDAALSENHEEDAEDPGRPAADENSHDDGDSVTRQSKPASDRKQRASRRAGTKTAQNVPVEDGDAEETEEASSEMTTTSEGERKRKEGRKRKKESDEVTDESSSKPTKVKKLPKRPRPHDLKESSAEENSSDNPPDAARQSKPAATSHGSRKKRTELVTLRGSVSEEDMEVQEAELQESGILQDYPTDPEDQSQVPAFVPLGLRSPLPVQAVVDETVEEDVVDFIAPENLEASEESYKEAAQTLLTIGDPDHIRQSTCAPDAVADQEQAVEELADTNTDPGEAGVSSEPGTSLCGVSFFEGNLEQGADVSEGASQLVDANSEEPIFIISLTEISPSFIETLPSDPDPPLSHTDLLFCNPEPLPSLSESLPPDTTALPCLADMLPPDTETLPSFSEAHSSSHEPLASHTEPHNLVADVVPTLKEPLPLTTDHPPTVSEPLSCLTNPSPVTAQLNTALEVQGNDDILETDRRPVTHLVVTDALVAVSMEEETEVGQNKPPECTEDISPLNLTMETSDIQPVAGSFPVPDENVSAETDQSQKSRVCDRTRRGKTPVRGGSKRTSAKCIPTQTTATPSVSEICKTDQPSCTQNVPRSEVKESQSDPDGVTVAALGEIQSFDHDTPQFHISTNSNEDIFEADRRPVAHLLVTDALVAVSMEEETEVGQNKPPECTEDISPSNLTMETSDIQPVAGSFPVPDENVSAETDQSQKSRVRDRARRGKIPVRAGSKRTSAKCIPTQTTATPSVSEICKTDQPSCTQNVPRSEVKESQSGSDGVTVAALGEIQSFDHDAPEFHISTNSNEDILEADRRPVTHLLVTDALVAVSMEEETEVGQNKPPECTEDISPSNLTMETSDIQPVAGSFPVPDENVSTETDQSQKSRVRDRARRGKMPVRAGSKRTLAKCIPTQTTATPSVSEICKTDQPSCTQNTPRSEVKESQSGSDGVTVAALGEIQSFDHDTPQFHISTNSNEDILEADRRPVTHLLVTDALVAVSVEEEMEVGQNKPPECTEDISPLNLTMETSDIQPVAGSFPVPDENVSTETDQSQKSRVRDRARRGKMPVRAGSKRTSAKCIPTQTTATPSVSEICKTDQPSCTQNVPRSEVKESQSGSDGVTVAALGEIQSFDHDAPQFHISTNSSDSLQTGRGIVSHLVIPDALVPVSEEEERKEEFNDHFSNKDLTSECLIAADFFDKTVHYSSESSQDDSTANNAPEPSTEDLSEVLVRLSDKPGQLQDPVIPLGEEESSSVCPVIRNSDNPDADGRAMSHPHSTGVADEKSWPLIRMSPVVSLARLRNYDNRDADGRAMSQQHSTGAEQNTSAKEPTPPFLEKPTAHCSTDTSCHTNTKAPSQEACVMDLSDSVTDQSHVHRTEKGIKVGTVAEEKSLPLLRISPVVSLARLSDWKVPEDDTRVVSHMIVTDALVPVSAETEENLEKREEEKCTERNLATASSTNENVTKSPAPLDNDDRVTEEVSSLKKRKLLEGTRRAKLQVKPALPARRMSSRNASAEKSTPPLSSTQSFPSSHAGSAQANSTQLPAVSFKSTSTAGGEESPGSMGGKESPGSMGREESPGSMGREDSPGSMGREESPASMGREESPGSIAQEESPAIKHSTPPVAPHTMTRPGRKPKGFLSFMSSKSEPAMNARKPPQVRSAQSRRVHIAPRTVTTATEPTPSCSSSNTKDLAVVTPNRSACGTESPLNDEVNPCESRQPSIRHHSEEPTKISEYFLSNIFTEVEEQD